MRPIIAHVLGFLKRPKETTDNRNRHQKEIDVMDHWYYVKEKGK